MCCMPPTLGRLANTTNKPEVTPGVHACQRSKASAALGNSAGSLLATTWSLARLHLHGQEHSILSRSGGEKGLRGSGAGTLGVPLGGTRRVGGLLGVAGRLSGTVSPFRVNQLA